MGIGAVGIVKGRPKEESTAGALLKVKAMSRISPETLSTLFWLGVGVFFALEGIRLGIRTARNPGPGFLPTIMGALLVLFSLFLLVKEMLKPTPKVVRIPWKRPLYVMAIAFSYILLLDCFAFLLSTFVVMFLLFGLLFRGQNRWRSVLLYALVTASCAWIVFVKLAKMPFPEPRWFGI